VTAARVALALTLAAAALSRFDAAAVAAEPRLRVVIVIDESDDPFAERIRAEVSALGLEVVTVEPFRTGEPIESLDAAGRANAAAAAIRMVPSRKGVEVWVATQPTGRSLLRQLIVDERPGAPNEGLVALQTAELLRTTLLARSDVPPAANRSTAADVHQVQPPPAPPPPPSGGLQAAAGWLYSPGGGGAATQLWMTFSQYVKRPFGVSLDVSAPLRAGTLTGPEGSANLGAWLGGAAVFVAYDRPGSVIYGRAAVGGAALRVTADGSTTHPSLLATSQTTTAGAVYARADGGFELAWWLHLGARVVAGAVPGGVAVHFAGNDAGTWGRPFLAAMLLVDVSWR
jgi:hypothetical protein